jgi:hypothetical protein
MLVATIELYASAFSIGTVAWALLSVAGELHQIRQLLQRRR